MPLSRLSLKDLEPEDARLALAAARFTAQELGVELKGRGVLVAFSGGADSTALLVLFCALRSHLDITVAAAHLDHGLRPESAAEAVAAAAFCRGLGVPFFLKKEDVAGVAARLHCGVEEAGRRARYAFLEEARQACGASWVLTAHHAGDLAEDVLMRLVRGAAWPGLGGMRGVVDEPGRHVLRPLLMQEKAALEAVLTRLGISWQEDGSNASRAWRRNRMRHDVLPLLLAENPSFLESVRRLWRCARRDEREMLNLMDRVSEQRDGGVFLPDRALKDLEQAGRLRCMAEAVRRVEGGQARADTLEAMEAAWLRRLFPRRFSFGGGVKAELSGKGAFFHRESGR